MYSRRLNTNSFLYAITSLSTTFNCWQEENIEMSLKQLADSSLLVILATLISQQQSYINVLFIIR